MKSKTTQSPINLTTYISLNLKEIENENEL